MRWSIPAALIVAAFSTGCAYTNPVQPEPTAVDLKAPFSLTVGAVSGSGTQAGTATLTARVQNASGAPLGNVVVTFTTTVGAVSPTAVTTGTDGRASAMLTASDTADVTARSGSLSAHSIVAVQGPVSGTPTPGQPPTPGAPSVGAVAFLNVAASVTTGTPLAFSVSSSAPGPWSWAFGDGATAQTTAFATTHTYGRAGTYTATVSSAATTAASATVTVTDAAVPPPAPTASPLSTVLSCVAGATTSCNVAASFNGARLGSTATSTAWDWGDGQTTAAAATNVGVHTYAQPGSFNVIATTTYAAPDGTLPTATAVQLVAITSVPVAAYTVTLAASPTSVTIGGSATLTATVTATNGAPATPTSFAWDCDGTGATIVTNSSNTKTCTYSTAGTTTSKVTVTGGTASGTGSTPITVTGLPALVVGVTASTLTPAVGANVTFTGTVTSTGTVPATLQWQWDDTNDGSPEIVTASAASPNTRTTAYGSVGVKTVKVTVTDTATGRTASGLLSVTVS